MVRNGLRNVECNVTNDGGGGGGGTLSLLLCSIKQDFFIFDESIFHTFCYYWRGK